jgi:low temperature requirement protein LtrA
MTEARAGESLLRTRGGHEASRVTFVELFFDLVFVFAVTQLSHTLLEHLDARGVLHTALLFLAVWWVWIYTSWATNWLDPAKTPVRLMLFTLMLAGLVLSTSIPGAFEGRGLAFAGAYVFMQVGRCLFTMRALRGHSPGNYRNFQRITCWLALSAVFWIAGAFAQGDWRIGLWLLALGIEYASPPLRFWTPGLGASTTQDWDVAGEHMAERCGLFIILSLGESILVTGTTFAKLPLTAATAAAFATAFVGSVAMWWIYFNIGAERARRNISSSSDPGRVARLSYTYLHIPLVAGIIVTAVGDELVLAHPGEAAGIY